MSSTYDTTLDSLTLEEKALACLVFDDPLHLVPDTETNQLRLQQRYALLTLPWESFYYIGSVHECDWAFVRNCTKSTAPATLGVQLVTEIVLYGGACVQGSTGTLSPDVGLLNNLVVFDIQLAGMTGSIPPSLGANWTNLYWFDVSQSALTGSLPALLGTTWTNLKYFIVSDNALTGNLPSALGTTWTNRTSLLGVGQCLDGTPTVGAGNDVDQSNRV
jgi:hypothetical protein